jgi:16S rRNA processing protein RimM
MSAVENPSAAPLVLVARAVKTRGLKGEIVADLLTDFPERFERLSELIAVGPGGERRIVELEHHWFQKQRVILKFSGFDSVEEATVLVGFDFGVPEADRVALPDGSYFDWELEGCLVETIQGLGIGKVSSVLPTGGVALLAVSSTKGQEVLVPMAESIVVQIDIEKKRIVIDPPEGLLDL